MPRLAKLAPLGREVRQEGWSELGAPTAAEIDLAVEEGRYQDARQLARYLTAEGKGLHDLMCDWVWDLLTRIAERHGEEEMHRILRQSQASWMMKRTWKAFLRLSVEDRVRVTAEIAAPCGSGGRMRLGDPLDGTPSRLGEPYRFGQTRSAHPWSWGRRDVPYYCVHCALNEILPMEWGGHPLWVTDYRGDAREPCCWHFYRSAELIPEEYYTRVGRKKPAPGEGSY
jgi:hypothetical protein